MECHASSLRNRQATVPSQNPIRIGDFSFPDCMGARVVLSQFSKDEDQSTSPEKLSESRAYCDCQLRFARVEMQLLW